MDDEATRRAGEAAADRIVDEARKAQDDERFGLFTNPFILGLLTAAEMVRGTDGTT